MKPERDEHAADAVQPALAVGEALADRRRALGLSLEDVALQLKFNVRQLEALERGRFERLSGPTFVRGTIRAYARLLRMDADTMVARAAASMPAPQEGPLAVSLRKPIPFSDHARRINVAYAALSLLVAGFIGALLWEWHAERAADNRLTFVRAAQVPLEPVRAPAPAPAQPVVQDSGPAPSADATLAGDDRRRITLQFEGESWVEIRARGGRILLSQLNPAGSERVIEGRPPFAVVIGNARQVRVRYGDEPIDLAPHTRVDVARFALE